MCSVFVLTGSHGEVSGSLPIHLGPLISLNSGVMERRLLMNNKTLLSGNSKGFSFVSGMGTKTKSIFIMSHCHTIKSINKSKIALSLSFYQALKKNLHYWINCPVICVVRPTVYLLYSSVLNKLISKMRIA